MNTLGFKTGSTLYLGDVHGTWFLLQKHIRKAIKQGITQIYQVGDLGIGFMGRDRYKKQMVLDRARKFPPEFKFIRGNHDNPGVCRNHPNYLGDFGYINADNLFFVSGGHSLDTWCRTEGINWWPDEELSSEQANDAYEAYVRACPETVISHEAPQEIATRVREATTDPTSTNRLLQHLWEAHPPKLWVFGHYHVPFDETIAGTRFVGLRHIH